MANTQDCLTENCEDFTKDEEIHVNGEDFTKDEEIHVNNENSSGAVPPPDSGSADVPGQDDDRKLFIGGLSWETTDKELREHFGQYGKIESINVKTDPNTGRSRGFAFLVFNNVDAINKVIAAGEHIINNKKVDPKKAKARPGKIFVGGITNKLSDDDIKNYFGQYGTIIEIELPFDKSKNQRKGFCFITFESEQVVNELLKTPKQIIKDKEVDVKRATPKPDAIGGIRGGRIISGRGGTRGRGRGGYGGHNWIQGYGGGGYGQDYVTIYDDYGGGFDYYSGSFGGYNSGYDNFDYDTYDYGFGNYDGGYGSARSARGKGGAGGFQCAKQRGGFVGGSGVRNQRLQPY